MLLNLKTDWTLASNPSSIGLQREIKTRLPRVIPGFGPLVPTATVAAIGQGTAFRRGRDCAAWLGVAPRQYSTAGKQKLFGMSKRGNPYLRRMLIHGARAVLLRVKYDTAGFGPWVHRLAQRAPQQQGGCGNCEYVGAHCMGRAYRAAATTTISGCSRWQLDGRGTDAALGKHKTLFHRHDG